MIPGNAKQVFKGILFDVYQWKQKMFDGSTQTFEAVKRVPSVQVIPVTKDKKILLLRERQPDTKTFISLPGGMIARDETPRQAAKRELLEETGFRPKKLLYWKKTNIGGKIDWETHYFIAYDCEKIVSPKHDSGEKIRITKKDFESFLLETQKKSFRNKGFSDLVLKETLTKQKKEAFKKQIFK